VASDICNDLIENPEKFWAELIHEISTWENVEEHDSEDPPTIL